MLPLPQPYAAEFYRYRYTLSLNRFSGMPDFTISVESSSHSKLLKQFVENDPSGFGEVGMIEHQNTTMSARPTQALKVIVLDAENRDEAKETIWSALRKMASELNKEDELDNISVG